MNSSGTSAEMRRVHTSGAQNSTGYLLEKSKAHIHKQKTAKQIRVRVIRRELDRVGVARRRGGEKG